MKRKILTTLGLCASLAMPITFTQPTQAATVKLNKSAITIYKGKTYKLKVTGTTAKVKWTSNNKKVATVTSTGTVKGIKKGTTYIKAKVGSKTLKCKVTVKENETVSAKKISYELKDTGDGVVAILKNNNSSAVSVEGTLVYFSKSGTMLKAVNDYNFCLEPNTTCVLKFSAPYNSNYQTVSYADYELSLQLEKPYVSSYGVNKIKVESNLGSNNVTAKITNTSNKKFDCVGITVLYFNSSGDVIGYEIGDLYDVASGSVNYESYSLPYDEDYETIIPASYKIYVNNAYAYAN